MTTSWEADSGDRGRLRWRCRRGLLENDLLIERFFARQQAPLSPAQVRGLQALMDLGDNDLLDLLLARSEPSGECDRPEVCEVLALMRPPSPTNPARQNPFQEGKDDDPVRR